MTDYLLRVAGVNIYAILADTNQLSVIRGGGLLLRNAIKRIKANFSQLWEISTGASEGLFKFSANNEAEAEKLRKEIVAWLNKEDHKLQDITFSFRHFTFVVDIQSCEKDDFSKAEEKVIARNRFRQLQQLSLAVPKENKNPKVPPCELDNLRPAYQSWGKDKNVSDSVFDRLQYGKEQKQKFYRDETHQAIDKDFVGDLHELSEMEGKKNLDRKIAVLYFDGNGFGKIQQKHCKTVEATREWDKYIQGKRRDFLTELLEKIKQEQWCKFLAELLEKIKDDSVFFMTDDKTCLQKQWREFSIELLENIENDADFFSKIRFPEQWRESLIRLLEKIKDDTNFFTADNKTCFQEQWRKFPTELLEKIKDNTDFLTTEGKIRLETLLWGGDEIIFVVPAWKGFALLNKFYDFTQDWNFEREKLTHAGGIVFCQASTPIQQVQKLARDLAEAVKDSAQGREDNFFDYAVLESIDYPTESLKTFRQQQFGELAGTRQFLKPFSKEQWQTAQALTKQVPKSQAYQLARAALHSEGEFKEQYERFQVVVEKQEEAIKALETLFPEQTQRWQWLHLVDLWDYLVGEWIE